MHALQQLARYELDDTMRYGVWNCIVYADMGRRDIIGAVNSTRPSVASPRAQALQPQLPSHDMFFNAFDGTRFAFPVFHKGTFTLLSHADHLVRTSTHNTTTPLVNTDQRRVY